MGEGGGAGGPGGLTLGGVGVEGEVGQVGEGKVGWGGEEPQTAAAGFIYPKGSGTGRTAP